MQTEIKHRRPPPLMTDNDEFSHFIKKDKIELNDKQAQTQSLNSDQSATTTSSLTFENFCWFIASITCVYFTDIINVILYDQNIYRHIMLFAFSLITCNVLIAFYLIVYVTYVKKINSNKWNELYPGLIPVATACFISGSILLTVAFWPVYSWLTAPILFTIFMGFIVIIINIPSFN